MTGAQLRAWRERLNLSQAEAAERIGCSRRGIQVWESGKRDIPKYIPMAISAVIFELQPYGDYTKCGPDVLSQHPIEKDTA